MTRPPERLGERAELIVCDLATLDLDGRRSTRCSRTPSSTGSPTTAAVRPAARRPASRRAPRGAVRRRGEHPRAARSRRDCGPASRSTGISGAGRPGTSRGRRRPRRGCARAGSPTSMLASCSAPAPYEELGEWLRVNALSAHQRLRLPSDLRERYVEEIAAALGPDPTTTYMRLMRTTAVADASEPAAPSAGCRTTRSMMWPCAPRSQASDRLLRRPAIGTDVAAADPQHAASGLDRGARDRPRHRGRRRPLRPSGRPGRRRCARRGRGARRSACSAPRWLLALGARTLVSAFRYGSAARPSRGRDRGGRSRPRSPAPPRTLRRSPPGRRYSPPRAPPGRRGSAGALLLVAGVALGSLVWVSALASVAALVGRAIGERALRLADAFAGLGMLGFGGALAYASARER